MLDDMSQPSKFDEYTLIVVSKYIFLKIGVPDSVYCNDIL